MKEIGKVKEYNNYYGTIVDEKGDKYLLLKEQIMNDTEINNMDIVSFVPEEYKKNEVDQKIARFVKKIGSNQDQRF